MASIPAEIVDLAESLNINLPARPEQEQFIRPGWAAVVGAQKDPHHNMVQRFRLQPEEVEATVHEVRAIFRERGRKAITWEVGGTATPKDLGERLGAFGIVPFAPEPWVAGMVLAKPLDVKRSELTVRRVTTLGEYTASARIFARCFGGHGEPEPTEEEIRERFDRKMSRPDQGIWNAYIGEEAVATAAAVFLPSAVVMNGGATLPEARGKGAYHALVAERWEEGRLRGTPMLVTQAGSMSRPILEKLGFEKVASVRIYLDEHVEE